MTEEVEIWKDVPGYEGVYAVSSHGRLKRLLYFKKGGSAPIQERILSPTKDTKGYLQTSLSINGKRKPLKVHKIVAMAFLDHVPCGMEEVIDHKDNNKLNNHAYNLQITTSRINGAKDRTSKSGLTGAYIKRGKSVSSQVVLDGKIYYLGVFSTAEDAHVAYNKAVEDYEIGIFPVIIHPNVTGYRGVYIKDQKYRATIRIGGKSVQIGYYDTPEEAARAYDRKALEFKPRAMKLNFPITNYITLDPV